MTPLKAALLIAVLATTSTSAAAAQPERLKLSYALYVGGMSALDGAVELTSRPGGYEVNLAAETKGLIGWLTEWRTRSVSRGAWRGDAAATQEHESHNLWRGQTRSVSLRYDAARAASVTAAPDAADDDRDPIPAEMLRATLDPLSGFVEVMEALRRGEGCGRTIAAFDGRRRFDMRFRDFGAETLPSGGYASFDGKARRCAVEYVAIAGYKRSPERNMFWRNSGGERPPVQVWFAEVAPGAPPAPVRMEAETPFGSVVAHLRGVEAQ